ncbi:MAG: helix-turn-helix domain-containing protein [Bacillota bacterium]
MKDIRDVLFEIIKDSGLKQKSIAIKANLSPKKLSDILNKRSGLSAEKFLDICQALSISTDHVKALQNPQKPAG